MWVILGTKWKTTLEGTNGDLSQHHGLAPLPGAAFDFNQVIEPPKVSTLYVSMESKTANIPQVFMITLDFHLR